VTLLARLATAPEPPPAPAGPGWRGVDLGFPVAALPEEGFIELAAVVERHDLVTVCVDSTIGAGTITDDFGTDLEELRVLAERCPALGTRQVRVGSPANAGLHADDWEYRVLRRLRELALRAEQADLVLLHPSTGGWPDGAEARLGHLLTEAGTPALRLLHTTGAGPLTAFVAERTAHVRVADAGSTRLAADLALLTAHGYRGALTLADDAAGAGSALQALAAGRAEP